MKEQRESTKIKSKSKKTSKIQFNLLAKFKEHTAQTMIEFKLSINVMGYILSITISPRAFLYCIVGNFVKPLQN